MTEISNRGCSSHYAEMTLFVLGLDMKTSLTFICMLSHNLASKKLIDVVDPKGHDATSHMQR